MQYIKGGFTKMIFITTGSRSFQFNRLLKAVDVAISEGKIKDSVFAQIGSSDYQIQNYEYIQFLNQSTFNTYIEKCDIVLTHGGTGVIVNAIKLGKRVVAVPRLSEYEEAVDDHQLQLVEEFDKLGMITPCFECTSDGIAKAIEDVKNKEIKIYESNTENIINSIDAMIQSKILKNKGNKIRVLMCSSARSEKGGMNSVIDQLMEHEWDNRLEFSYLGTHITGTKYKKILYFLKAYSQLKKLIKKDRFDIIHIHMSYKGSFYRKYLVTKLCKKYDKKVIIHLHGSEFKDFYNKGNDKLKRKIKELFTIVDYAIVLGDDWKEFIKGIAEESKVVVINNAIKIPSIYKKEENRIPILLFLGALIKRKGVIDLLTAVKNVKERENLEFKVLIAGSGEEETLLKTYVEENNLQNIVKFLGWVDTKKKAKLLNEVDILVLPSYNEGLPIAILEALAYGVPVISTNVGSIAEAVIDNQDGFLFDAGDSESLSELMSKLIIDRKLWSQLSIGARSIAEKKFSEEKFFEDIQKLYLELGE